MHFPSPVAESYNVLVLNRDDRSVAEIPKFITHYCLPDRQPFLTLSELTADEEESIFENLRNRYRYDSSYRRRYGKDYLDHRREIENKLRCLFVNCGGEPVRRYPFYFVLGKSRWFENLNEGHVALQLDIASLNPATTSFTFPDSYIALSRCDKPYHGRVFLLHELKDVVERHGLPDNSKPLNYQNYWKGDFEKYIEFQIWEDKIVQPFIDQYLSTKSGCNSAPTYSKLSPDDE